VIAPSKVSRTEPWWTRMPAFHWRKAARRSGRLRGGSCKMRVGQVAHRNTRLDTACTPTKNRKHTNITRNKLVFDPKPLHTSHGRDTKLHMVSHCECQGTTSLVGIVLLVGHGSLQIGLDTMNNFLCLCDKIRAKGYPLTRFNPV
jgi:hypothetical protein